MTKNPPVGAGQSREPGTSFSCFPFVGVRLCTAESSGRVWVNSHCVVLEVHSLRELAGHQASDELDLAQRQEVASVASLQVICFPLHVNY